MALTKVSTGMLSADLASVDLNIDANTLYIDVSNNRVGINNTGPATALDVTGTVTADGLTVDGNITLGAGDKLQYNSDRYFTPENNVDGAEVSANGVFRIKTGTTPAARLLVGGNGDISFYEDTGTTAKFFWDASAESLGIGTSLPQKIHGGASLDGETSTGFEFIAGNSTVSTVGGEFLGGYAFRNNDSSGTPDHYSGIRAVAADSFGSANLEFYSGRDRYEAGTAPNMTILGNTSSTDGFVGIGTSSPVAILTTANSGPLTLDSNDGDHSGFGLLIEPSTITVNTVNSAIGFASTSGRKYAAIGMQTYADADQNGLNFYVQSTASGSSATLTEAMRIDASGNLLVGKTANNITGTGVVVRSTGETFATRSGAEPLSLNRLSTDGDVLTIRKDSAVVGSIGSATKASVSRLMIGTGETNLYFFDTDNTIYPVNSNGTDSDADTDLGASGVRFKDLYLSGGVYWGSDQDASNNTTTNGTDILQGNIRIASTSYCLDLNRANSTDGELARFRKQAAQVGGISVTGSSTSYNTSSDYRLKENVVAMSGATERLKQLAPKRFNFIADADTTVDGFLAHEVQDIVPEAITGEKDAMINEEYEVTPAVLDDDGNIVTEAVMGTRSVPDYQGIDQSKLVPLLVATIQELEARIAALES